MQAAGRADGSVFQIVAHRVLQDFSNEGPPELRQKTEENSRDPAALSHVTTGPPNADERQHLGHGDVGRLQRELHLQRHRQPAEQGWRDLHLPGLGAGQRPPARG